MRMFWQRDITQVRHTSISAEIRKAYTPPGIPDGVYFYSFLNRAAASLTPYADDSDQIHRNPYAGQKTVTMLSLNKRELPRRDHAAEECSQGKRF